ncbi:MAG: NAD(+)/NADH kinase [bacterium]|nr:NAD(+)/NADH kinase [bacterium]
MIEGWDEVHSTKFNTIKGLFTDLQIQRVLVVYKKSYYELYGYEHRERHFKALESRHHPIIQSMQLSHEENKQTLAQVCVALDAVGLAYDCIFRGELERTDGYDLVLSVGGDGTFLELARYTAGLPILGVNSDPARSMAFFCGANRQTIQQQLEALIDGSLGEVRLARMEVRINDEQLPHAGLNDLLIAHANPAAVSSYTLQVEQQEEQQKSSGIWIATAAGSTAAMRAAGGRVLPLRSRKLQYLVREPYAGDRQGYQLLKGEIASGQLLRVTSRMRRGRIFMDGSHLRFLFGLGDVLSVSSAADPVRVLGLDGHRRRRF